MAEKNTNRGTMKRRGYLKGLAAGGLGVGTLSVASTRAHADTGKDDEKKNDEKEEEAKTHDLKGDDLYLIFGADSSEKDLGGWVDKHRDEINGDSQESLPNVIQYQEVSQLNVLQQGNAVSIAIDGADATAVQETEQDNVNVQDASAESIDSSYETRDETFYDPSRVHIVFAEETGCRTFSGWVSREDTYENGASATATIEQEQTVDQFNYNSQSTSMAVAEKGSCARSYQRSWQANENYQHAEAVAANIGEGDRQGAEASVEQAQDVSQLNVSEQGVAIAIAVGKCSTAEAYQLSSQLNVNEQTADATAISFGFRSPDDILKCAEMEGELPEDAVERTDDGKAQSNGQASAEITQVQCVGQENINLQNAAIALAKKDSDATARQVSYQGNFNAQVATAEGLNVSDGRCSASTVLNGAATNDDGSWALAYENGDSDVDLEEAAAGIDQYQFVEQVNVNEQFSAIAYATRCGEATAEQLNYQANQNVQVTEARAVGDGDGEEKDEKDEKKGKKDDKGKKDEKKNGKDKEKKDKKDEKKKTKH
ncbi:hypothetical protein C491_18454 [Natronococcus amylolyticus DSM 10524]|uniref:Uncharacterized protein n=1 Tax=Natronococcus amylolyticus DSM 10524 TaxID=1227497 RepID=L9WZL4_9EURY|nr:hypothetical protein [Natronococcus amylolyticus]ELY54611.1 hypothetical protein C491_18454 [Natronococcus amylolyticus DSM 10524]